MEAVYRLEQTKEERGEEQRDRPLPRFTCAIEKEVAEAIRGRSGMANQRKRIQDREQTRARTIAARCSPLEDLAPRVTVHPKSIATQTSVIPSISSPVPPNLNPRQLDPLTPYLLLLLSQHRRRRVQPDTPIGRDITRRVREEEEVGAEEDGEGLEAVICAFGGSVWEERKGGETHTRLRWRGRSPFGSSLLRIPSCGRCREEG